MKSAKTWAILFFVLWLVTLFWTAKMFFMGNIVASSDERTAIGLTKAERAALGGEMRSFLQGVQTAANAGASGKTKEAAPLLMENGFVQMNKVGLELMTKFPVGFKQLGMNVHQQFEDLSKDYEQGLEPAAALARVGQLLDGCMACHQAYKVEILD